MHRGRVWSRNSFRQGPGEIPSWLTLGTVQLKSVLPKMVFVAKGMWLFTRLHTHKSIVMQLILQKLTKDLIEEIWRNQLF